MLNKSVEHLIMKRFIFVNYSRRSGYAINREKLDKFSLNYITGLLDSYPVLNEIPEFVTYLKKRAFTERVVAFGKKL